MKNHALLAKHLGELAEERFKLIARSLGLIVCKPETQLTRYDFILDLAGIPGLFSRRKKSEGAPSFAGFAKGGSGQRPKTDDRRRNSAGAPSFATGVPRKSGFDLLGWSNGFAKGGSGRRPATEACPERSRRDRTRP